MVFWSSGKDFMNEEFKLDLQEEVGNVLRINKDSSV
jgi:hypothetical protein